MMGPISLFMQPPFCSILGSDNHCIQALQFELDN